MKRKTFLLLFAVSALTLFCSNIPFIFAQEAGAADKTVPAETADKPAGIRSTGAAVDEIVVGEVNIDVTIQEDKKLESPDEIIVEELEEAAKAKKEEIKKAAEEVTKARVEAEDVKEDKEVLEKEAIAKEQQAVVAVQELKVLKKETEGSNDPEKEAKAKELETQAVKAKKDVEIIKERLKIAEFKTQLAQKKLEARQAKIDDLKEDFDQLQSGILKRQSLFYKVQRGVIIVVVGLLAIFLLRLFVSKFEKIITKKDVIRENERVLNLRTMMALFRWLGTIVILGLIVYLILESIGLNMAPLLAGAGIAGLAFGFGGQYLIRDIINGIFILLEGQYRINDVIKINDIGGLVEQVTLRLTKLRDLEGKVIYIPNGEIKSVINYTQEYAQALLNIGVAYKENVDRVMEVIKEVGAELRKDPHFKKLILDDLDMLGVDDFADSQVTIKFRIKTLAMKQWTVAREFRRRIKNRFDELGIEIPFPHRTLYLGSGKDNEWLKEWALGEGNKKPGKKIED
ncbi:mechanosensitive ion channel domain-containing protein [Candidatus Auribacterota bacterium]